MDKYIKNEKTSKKKTVEGVNAFKGFRFESSGRKSFC